MDFYTHFAFLFFFPINLKLLGVKGVLHLKPAYDNATDYCDSVFKYSEYNNSAITL